MDSAQPFRAVERFVQDALRSVALEAALTLGLIDRLVEDAGASKADLQREFQLAPRGMDMLLRLLTDADVVYSDFGTVRLTDAFLEALAHRSLLELKLRFARHALSDFTDLTVPLCRDDGEFMARSAVFELFRYDHALAHNAQNLAATRRWVELTTGLTRYEAPALLELLNFQPGAQVLDIGGNSGELARAIAETHTDVHVTVLDLPVVCDIGREHTKGSSGEFRIRFLEGDARATALPLGMDVIIFKSMLHDWPNTDAGLFLELAAKALSPGGRLVVFERKPFAFQTGATLAYHDLPNLAFLHFLREPTFYREIMADLGLQLDPEAGVRLDMPFSLTVGRKPHA